MLESRMGQACKEAIACWCLNADKGYYEPTSVLLSDGSSVLLVEYTGHNKPGGGAKLYKHGMPCNEIFGALR